MASLFGHYSHRTVKLSATWTLTDKNPGGGGRSGEQSLSLGLQAGNTLSKVILQPSVDDSWYVERRPVLLEPDFLGTSLRISQ